MRKGFILTGMKKIVVSIFEKKYFLFSIKINNGDWQMILSIIFLMNGVPYPLTQGADGYMSE